MFRILPFLWNHHYFIEQPEYAMLEVDIFETMIGKGVETRYNEIGVENLSLLRNRGEVGYLCVCGTRDFSKDGCSHMLWGTWAKLSTS